MYFYLELNTEDFLGLVRLIIKKKQTPKTW